MMPAMAVSWQEAAPFLIVYKFRRFRQLQANFAKFQFEEPTKNITPSRFADREADTLLRLVKPVVEVEVGPAVGGGNGLIHLDVEFPEFLNVLGGFVGIVEAVVGLC